MKKRLLTFVLAVVMTMAPSCTNATGTVKNLSASNSSIGLEHLTIISVNCGKFEFTDGVRSDEQYKNSWRSMINNSGADIFALTDYTDTFGQNTLGQTSEEIIFGNTLSCFLWDGAVGNSDHNIRLGCKSPIAEFIKTIDVGGGEASSRRHYVSKYRIKAFGNEVFLYLGHYYPGAGGASVRSAQYANIIQDAMINKHNYVIFAGDFNAQTISEYQPFADAGYLLANGGYMGDQLTLIRGSTQADDPDHWNQNCIPADNIIYSSNLTETNFEVIRDFDLDADNKAPSSARQLNTDHVPIRITLKLR